VKPWQFQGRHKDGSLRVDIPLQSLHLYFNVTYSIISQVNPHIHLFFFQPRGAPGKPVNHRKGKGWRGGFFLSAAEQFLKLDLTKNFRVIRDLELMPELLGQNWSGVFLQKFEGSVTIWPKSRIKDWTRLLDDPDEAELRRMIRVGQTVTWPKLHMIENRMRIERQIDVGRAECRAAYAKAGRSSHRSTNADSRAVLTDSSTVEDSDSDLDLGGPEANAPLPDNDETLEEDTDAAERREEEEDRERRSRRAASAPASPHAARKRRRQIMSSLGITHADSPAATPNLENRHGFDFAGDRAGTAAITRTDFGASSSYSASANGNQGRRRLSTGQLWLNRRNRGSSGAAFGSGVSGDEDGISADDLESERSYDRRLS